MQVLPQVHRIETIVGGRRVCQTYLDSEPGVLIDVGDAEHPQAAIAPYLETIGRRPEDVGLALVTHADTDHHGGLASLRRLSPDVRIACGAADRALVEDARVLVRDRYRAYEAQGVGYPAGQLDGALSIEPVRVDDVLHGGERLRIDDGWELEILATPGHSAGHVAVRDLRHDAVYAGDAVHGAGYPDVDGNLVMPPNYVDVSDYLATIELLRAVSPRSLHGAHWPILVGDKVARFLDESEAFVRRLAALVDGAPLPDAIAAVQRGLAEWAGCAPIELAYAVEAHRRGS